VPVMAAGFHLIDPGPAAIDRRDAVFDPGGKHEVGQEYLSFSR
jgi:hypothetical protein